MTQLKGIFELGPTKAILDFLRDNLKLNSYFSFLGVLEHLINTPKHVRTTPSSIHLLTDSLTHSHSHHFLILNFADKKLTRYL